MHINVLEDNVAMDVRELCRENVKERKSRAFPVTGRGGLCFQ
jgi:hypothetical protein